MTCIEGKAGLALSATTSLFEGTIDLDPVISAVPDAVTYYSFLK